MRSLKIYLILGLVISLLLISGCDFIKSPFTSDSNDNDDNDEPANCITQPSIVYYTGDSVTAESCYFDVTLKSVQETKTVCNGEYESEQGRYVIVDVKIEVKYNGLNQSSWYLCYSQFYITDEEGNTYHHQDVGWDYAIRTCVPGTIKNSDCAEFRKGGVLSGKIVFDVGSSDLTLSWDGPETPKGKTLISFDLGI